MNKKKNFLKFMFSNIGKIATRIMGLVLAAMMVLSVAATLIYYIAFNK